MKKKVVNKRDAVKAMREFANEASSLTCGSTDKKSRINMRKDVENYGFATLTYNAPINSDLPSHTIFYNFESLYTRPVSIFRIYWTEVAPIFNGFANVTLVLLHELGHLHTQDNVLYNGYDIKQKNKEWQEIENTAQNLEEANARYFLLQDEMTATLWAIDWLKDAEHRKLAKRFEKKFFACCKQKLTSPLYCGEVSPGRRPVKKITFEKHLTTSQEYSIIVID